MSAADELRSTRPLGRAEHGRIASIAGTSYSLPVCLLDPMDVLHWSGSSSAFKLISRIVLPTRPPKSLEPCCVVKSSILSQSQCVMLYDGSRGFYRRRILPFGGGPSPTLSYARPIVGAGGVSLDMNLVWMIFSFPPEILARTLRDRGGGSSLLDINQLEFVALLICYAATLLVDLATTSTDQPQPPVLLAKGDNTTPLFIGNVGKQWIHHPPQKHWHIFLLPWLLATRSHNKIKAEVVAVLFKDDWSISSSLIDRGCYSSISTSSF
jgi:hypothetical protein